MASWMRRAIILVLFIPLLLPGGPGGIRSIAAAPLIIVEHGFEDGTTQGWGPRGSGVALAATSEAAHSGTLSLKTSGRTANWHGPSLDVRSQLLKDATYEISGYVRLVLGQPASTLKLTVQRTPTGGSTQYEQVAASPNNGVTDGAWVLLRGSYTYSTDVTELQLYLESSDPTSQYYLDDLTITQVTAPPPDQSGIETGFEDNTAQGWRPRIGIETLTVTSAEAHGGSYSLLTTGRQHTYDGPSLDVLNKMHTGSKYRISLWAKLAPGEPATQLRVSIQRSLADETHYDTVVGSTAVTNTEWVNLAADYTLANEVDTLSIYIEAESASAAFLIDDFRLAYVPALPIQTDIPALHEALADYFPVGAALEPYQLEDIHADLLKRHFNMLVAENVMKPGPLQPSEGQFNWTEADKLVQFARANNIQVRGHTLVWHSQNPDWLFKDAAGNDLQPTPENKALVLARLEAHIRAVVDRYKDDIGAWDVVNEVIDPGQPDGLRRSTWFTLTGLDYIRTAFRVAREADPDALLFINDYSTTDTPKRTFLYNLVRDLRAEGVPIDGVGHQMHINIASPSASAIEETISLFAGLGVEQHITELDMSVYSNGTDIYTSVPQQVLVEQGYRYKEVFDVFKRQSAHIGAVMFWGLADDHTWLKTFPITRLDLPLLFDEQLQAKPAYWGIVDPTRLPVQIQQLNTHQGTPLINARADLHWDMLPWTELRATETLSASFKTLWDSQHLYLLAWVRDATNDPNDTVELFIDHNNGKTPTYQPDDVHYRINRRGVATPAAGVRTRVVRAAGGYQLQVALPLPALAERGDQLGFDIRVRDARQPNAPVSWNDPTGSQDSDTSKYGTLTLIDSVDVATAARGTPVIDGTADAIWSRAEQLATTTWVTGNNGATATFKTLWDDQHLYIFATISDGLLSKASANPWEQDSIEIFVDQNNGKTGTYQPDDGQYRVNYDNQQSFGGSAAASGFTTATRLVPGGYVVEAAVALDAIQPQKGGLIGFDFQVNDDSQGNGSRSGVVTWSDPTGESYRNTSRFGVLLLRLRAEGRS